MDITNEGDNITGNEDPAQPEVVTPPVEQNDQMDTEEHAAHTSRTPDGDSIAK